MEGASLEMYTEYLSPSFHGLTFSDAVCVCFTKLKLLLIAIEIRIDNKRSHNSMHTLPPQKSILRPEILLRNRRKRLKDTRDHESVMSLSDEMYVNIRFNEQGHRRFDSSGMFHWCPNKEFESVILSYKDELSSTVFFQSYY